MSVDLEQSLRACAEMLQPTEAPDYATRILPRLAERPRNFVRPARRLLIAAALVLAAVVTTVAVPAGRHALASWLGFSGIDVRRVPAGSALPVPTAPQPLDAGRLVTLNEAQATAGKHTLALPEGLSRPDRVYVRRDHAAIVVTLAYRHAPGLHPTIDTGYSLIVTELFDAGYPLYQKLLHTSAVRSTVQVGGLPGLYIAGPQELITLDTTRQDHGSDTVHDVAARTSANTLMWSSAAATYRIEGDFTRRAALALGVSFR
jgi:hypothetical protein